MEVGGELVVDGRDEAADCWLMYVTRGSGGGAASVVWEVVVSLARKGRRKAGGREVGCHCVSRTARLIVRVSILKVPAQR